MIVSVWQTGDTTACHNCLSVTMGVVSQVTLAAGRESASSWCCAPPTVYCTRPNWVSAAVDTRSRSPRCWSRTCRSQDSCGCWCTGPQLRRTAVASAPTAASTWAQADRWGCDQGCARGASGCHSPAPSPPTGGWRRWSDSSRRTTCWCSRLCDTAAVAGLKVTCLSSAAVTSRGRGNSRGEANVFIRASQPG